MSMLGSGVLDSAHSEVHLRRCGEGDAKAIYHCSQAADTIALLRSGCGVSLWDSLKEATPALCIGEAVHRLPLQS